MSWFLVDDNFSDHPKVVRLLARPNGFAAIGLWTLCGAWSRKHGTGGDVSAEAADMSARKCGQNADASALASALVEADLWLKTADGFRFKDWSDIYREQDKAAKRKQKDAERKRRTRRGQPADKDVDASADSPQDRSADTGSSPSPSPSPSLTTFERESASAHTGVVPVLQPIASDLLAVNAQGDRRTGPRDVTAAQVHHFDEVLRSMAFARELTPPTLGRDQRARLASRAADHGALKGIPFERACEALIGQALDDAAATNGNVALALASAEPGQPKQAWNKPGAQPEREVSKATQDAIAEANRLRAAGKYF